jgi:integrase
MQDICIFALATGMRAGEILSLEWSQVDKLRGLVSVLATKAKSKTSRPVPLNSDSLDVINRRVGKHRPFVFARAGQESTEIDRLALGCYIHLNSKMRHSKRRSQKMLSRIKTIWNGKNPS